MKVRYVLGVACCVLVASFVGCTEPSPDYPGYDLDNPVVSSRYESEDDNFQLQVSPVKGFSAVPWLVVGLETKFKSTHSEMNAMASALAIETSPVGKVIGEEVVVKDCDSSGGSQLCTGEKAVIVKLNTSVPMLREQGAEEVTVTFTDPETKEVVKIFVPLEAFDNE